ncbi:hypothetical protein GZH49_12695 [Nocardia terpenica]|uniref:hypothetical protein n=1 Tax=Nocardia terpenica TaxID=455432 RepID=UPI002FE34AE4
MLIAVAGVDGSRAGTSTTALALAAAWPTRQPVIVLEADPRGGRLTEQCGGDPHRGLASLTAAVGETDPLALTNLTEHLQWHPAGVAYLAAPSAPEHAAAVLSYPVRLDTTAGRTRARGEAGELVVIADCGVAAPGSAAAPLLSGADLTLLVVRAPGDPALLGRHLRDLMTWCPRLCLVVIGSASQTIAAPGVPVLGWLPHQESAAADLAQGREPRRHREFASAARTLAAAVRSRTTPETAMPEPRAWTAWRRSGRAHARRDCATPRVYGIKHRSLGDGTASREPVYQAPSETTAHPITPGHTCAPSPSSGPPATPAPVVQRSATVAAPCALLAAEPAGPPPLLALRLFGPLRVMWRPEQARSGPPAPEVEITARIQRRSREVLALLATHPHGVSRAQLIDALWGPSGPQRPANAVYTTLARLRAAVADATGGTVDRLLDTDSGRYRLNPAVVSADYAEFIQAVTSRRRATTDAERREIYGRIVELAATGVLAADLDADWLDPIREAARRDAITAVGALAQLLADTDPRATLHLLETALDIDPRNEHIYRDILRLHDRLGEHHAIDDTLTILTRRLAEIGETPSRETLELAHHLQRKRNKGRFDR